jgi:hypothetical protein
VIITVVTAASEGRTMAQAGSEQNRLGQVIWTEGLNPSPEQNQKSKKSPILHA